VASILGLLSKNELVKLMTEFTGTDLQLSSLFDNCPVLESLALLGCFVDVIERWPNA
jgi:hypothetical protein